MTGVTPARAMRIGLLGLWLGALLACASAEPVPGSAPGAASAPVRPLLWSAAAPEPGGARLYLLGSIHMGTPDLSDLGPAVAAAWQASSELVVEVDVSRLDAVDSAVIMAEHGTLRDGRTLRDLLEPETFAALEQFMTDQGVPSQAWLTLKPWLASTMVAVSQLQASGLDPGYGVDQQFLDRATVSDKPIVELESFASQMRMLDGLAFEIQELMLEETLLRSADVGDETLGLLESWKRGDEQALSDYFFGTIEERPEFEALYEKVFFERNERMSERLEELARDGKTRFVVVGAGHMVGPRGIPALLEKGGFRVERVSER